MAFLLYYTCGLRYPWNKNYQFGDELVILLFVFKILVNYTQDSFKCQAHEKQVAVQRHLHIWFAYVFPNQPEKKKKQKWETIYCIYAHYYQEEIWMASLKHQIIYRSIIRWNPPIKSYRKILGSKLSIFLSDNETKNISCLLKN